MVKKPSRIIVLTDHKCGYHIGNHLTELIRTASQGTHVKPVLRVFFRFWCHWEEDAAYVILSRAEKNIVISGYNYHKRDPEDWTDNAIGDYYSYWREHHFLSKFSSIAQNRFPMYATVLNSLPLHDGLRHEMNHVAKLTIAGQRAIQSYFGGRDNVLFLDLDNLDYQAIDVLISSVLDSPLPVGAELKKNFGTNPEHATDPNKSRYWSSRLQDELQRLDTSDILIPLDFLPHVC